MSRPPTYGGTGPAWLVWVTRISLVLGLAALVITVWIVGPEALLEHLEAIGPWFALLLVLELVVSLLDAGAMYSLTRGPGAPSGRQVIVAQLAGRAVNSVTPGGTVGEALRVSLLAKECSTHRIVAAVLFANLGALVIGVFIIAAGSIATAAMFELPRAAEGALLGLGGVGLVLAVAIVVLVRRGMLVDLARLARRLRVISSARFERWREQLANVDHRLVTNEGRSSAVAFLIASQVLQRVVTWMMLLVAGYSLSAPQVIAIVSAGVLLTWVAALVPMGVGVAEGGHGALFALIGAPTSLGVALAFARRVNQVVFAALGFTVLAVDRIAHADVRISMTEAHEQARLPS